ncbi:immunity 52 family protein [Pyxidicoccus parkwayensis]|uniref:Immunity 52 family protein n=1 Tax=Pyxidicoccus parkwayensis TaxID=2813578 RepID=A0ABX7P0T9_9BACT|nr:immunity 52 family protein [Pyxidicoccus parkwaysis]QSQ23320.1 immunity 52 family protein [Pyxidicoccus parkwaysis]
MIETYYSACYWPPRHETVEACARRAEDFFRRIGLLEPTWNRWHEPGSSFAKARERQVELDSEAFMKRFLKKKNRVGKDGFHYWLWAGDNPKETSGATGLCGSDNQWLQPVCLLKAPNRGVVMERVLTAPVLTEVVRAMALAWDPECGIATSDLHRDTAWKEPEAGTFTGWVMYFSRQRGTVPPLPAPVRIEPVEDKGTLVILTPERFTASNPEHVALAARVQKLLDRAGLLRPLHPPTAK